MISVYIIFYHDLQFLDTIIARIDPFVDEIILIDGPYKYSIPLFRLTGLYYNETTKPDQLTKIILKYPKIKYFFREFENEEEKRIFGYSCCSHNTILLVDSDEFFELNIANIKRFELGEKAVGRFDIYNMNRYDIYFNDKVFKYVCFKKDLISAEDHLDYLWLVGCKTKEQNYKIIDYSLSLGMILHQTLNRNKFNNIIKFIFYVSLYCKNNFLPIRLLMNYENEKISSLLTIKQIQDILFHSKIDYIGVPPISSSNICKKLPFTWSDMEMFKNNHIDAYLTDEMVCICGTESYSILPDHIPPSFKIITENVRDMEVSILEVPLNKPYKIIKFRENTINYTPTDGELVATVILFNCLLTIDPLNPIFKILCLEYTR